MSADQQNTPKKSFTQTLIDLFQAALEVMKPVVITTLMKAVAKNVGGIQGWLFGIALKYGGLSAFMYIKAWVLTLEQKIQERERAEAQKKALEEKDKVLADPNSTIDQVGKAYEDAFNAGKPKK